MLVVETITKIRRAHFVHKKPIKAICRDLNVCRNVVRKVLRSDATTFRYERGQQSRPKLGPWTCGLNELLAANEAKPAGERLTLVRIFEMLSSLGYEGGYDAVRRHAKRWKKDHFSSLATADVPLSFVVSEAYQFELSHDIANLSVGTTTRKVAGIRLCDSIKPSAEDRARDWLHSIVVGTIPREQISQDIGELDDLPNLLTMVQSGKRLVSNRALTILAAKKGISARATHRILGIDRRSYRKYVQIYKDHGTEGLLVRKPASNRKFDSEPLKQAVFSLLHEPPSNYNINRTSWRMADFTQILAKNGHPACPDVIRTITKSAGYRWRKARLVLTSQDPEYQQKLARIQSILSNLEPNESFFSIDEFGPFAVKHRQGRKLVAPGEAFIVPQWQKSKGCLILTAALELSSNQVTHFYSKKKNTSEMIRLMDVLVQKYSDQKRIYLSWDAASWHISKKLYEHIDSHNGRHSGRGGPQVETAPLPAGAQFLNVIESVFSGMARAIIHNSDYGSVDEAKAAIDQYFLDRNANFARNPRRAGKKIWGEERELAEFSCANNCKDPRYR